MAANLFERLAKGRPPPTPKFGNSELAHDLQILHEWLQRRDEPIVCLRDICHHGPRVLDQNLCMSLGSSFHAARFALSYHVLTARSAARMDLAIGMSGSTGWGEIIANPVRSERL